MTTRRALVALASAVAAVSLPAVLRATAVDFSTFTGQQGVQASGGAVPVWQTLTTYNNMAVASGRVAQVTPDSDTTYFVGPSSLSVMNKVITGDVYFGSDDDPVGLAFGLPQDPFTNTSANYLLLQWKAATQTFDFHDVAGSSAFHNSTVGGQATIGLSLSRVSGVPTADEFWQRQNLVMYDPQGKTTPDPATDPPLGFDTGGLSELGRGLVSGAKGFDRTGGRVPFEITYTPTNITVKVGANTEFNINAPAGQDFPDGTLGLYQQFQAGNGAFSYFDVRNIGDPAPTPGPNLSPAGQPFAAADVAVTVGNTNASSVWSIARGTTASSGAGTAITVVPHGTPATTGNIGDAEFALNGTKPTSTTGVMIATVRQNGPRDNGVAGQIFYGGVEAASPSGFGATTGTGLATFPYATSGQGGEWNMNVAVAQFPYSTFRGGYVGYDATTHNSVFADDNSAKPGATDGSGTISAVHLALPTIVQYDASNYTASGFWSAGQPAFNQVVTNLQLAGVHSVNDSGLLFTTGTSNENNTTSVAVLPNGSWNIGVRDAWRSHYGGPDTFEEDNFAYVYVQPGQIAESAGARVTGLNGGAPQVAQSWGNYTIDHVKPGVYELAVAGGETYTINALQMVLSGGITAGAPPTNQQILTPALADTAFSVAFLPFTAGDPSTGMLMLVNNGTLTMKDSAGNTTSNGATIPITGTNDVLVPTNWFLTYAVGGVPTWKNSGGGNWSDAGNWRLGVPNSSTASANLSHAIAAPQTVTLDAPVSLANLYFNSPQKYTVAGSAGNALSVSSQIGVYGGSHEIAAPVVLTSPAKIEIANGAKLKMSGHISGKASGLSIDATSTLDMTNNKLIVAGGNVGHASGGMYSGMSGLIQQAYDFGGWDQPGLTTSMADAASGLTTLAIGDADALGYTGGTFNGSTLNSGDVMLMYTYAGDANLDGVIDGGDYGIIDNFAQIPGADGYANGDFNYDGVIDGGDYGIIDNNIQAQGAPFPTSGGISSAITAVPEPAAMTTMFLVPMLGLARRRRSRRRQ